MNEGWLTSSLYAPARIVEKPEMTELLRAMLEVAPFELTDA